MPCKVDKIKLNRNQDRRARVTGEQVKEMRELYEKGYTQKAIAEIFGVCRSTVCYIVSEKAHKRLAEYRKHNHPKRRTTEEAREYARNLRSYKMKIYHLYPREKVKKSEINKKADCKTCVHAQYKGEHIYDCDAQFYDIKTLSCYEPCTQKGGVE